MEDFLVFLSIGFEDFWALKEGQIVNTLYQLRGERALFKYFQELHLKKCHINYNAVCY